MIKYFKLVLVLLLLTIPFVSIGYSALQTTLNISGDFVMLGPPTLYNVLANEGRIGTYAREYIGSHMDSFSGDGTQKIYHWYAPYGTAGNDNSSIILNKHNVIFADHCWQMIRTTDTGGVKMIYNGEVENGMCLETRGNHVGYSNRTNTLLNSQYYYGTDYTYDVENKVFRLTGALEQTIWNNTTYQDLIGKYTCKLNTQDGTCQTLYLVEGYSNENSASVILLNSNSHYSQFGTLQFNSTAKTVSSFGYMYNKDYYIQNSQLSYTDKIYNNLSLNVNFWYADSISVNSNIYSLVDSYKVSSSSEFSNLVGKYTTRSTGSTSGSTVYYIVAVNESTAYMIELKSGNPLSDYNYVYTYGDSYIDEGNGKYSIVNPSTIDRISWYSNYGTVGTGKYICKNAINDSCSDLIYLYNSSSTSMSYSKKENHYKYANDVTWDGTKYILSNDSIDFIAVSDVNNQNNITTHHYTCNNLEGECEKVNYIISFSGEPVYMNYVILEDGKNIIDAINEIFYNDDVNSNNSIIKKGVDAWYEHYLLAYGDYIEDTIFCNDRSQANANTNVWNPNGGTTNDLNFINSQVITDLSCENETDRFSTLNSKAKLKYPVGLISTPERNISNNSSIRGTGQNYWTISPYSFVSSNARGRCVLSTGGLDGYSISGSIGVRPVLSLKPGTEYVSGDGSMANPYVVEAYPLDNNRLVKNTSDVSKTFGKNISRNSFESITTVKSNVVPNDAIDSWDVSVLQNGSIMAWYTDSNSNGLYELYIGQLGGVKANVESDYAFYKFEKVTLMDLRNFKTTGVTSMYRMFENAGYSAGTFTILGLSNFDTSSADSMLYMFRNAGYNSTSCDLGSLSSWDVSNVTNMSYMFSYTCKSSPTFDLGNLSNWDTSNVSNMSYMFYHGGELASTWNIGTLNISASNISYMFNQNANANCTLNILKNPTQYSSIFGSSATSLGHSITVNYTSAVSNIDAIIATKSSTSNVKKGNLLN